MKRIFFTSLVLSLGACLAACGSDAQTLISDGGQGGTSDGGGGLGGTGAGGGSAIAATITGVTIDQAVQRPLEGDSDVPLVGGRQALLRLHYEGATPGAEVQAAITLDGEPFAPVVATLASASEDDDLGSTINADVSGAALSPGAHELEARLLDEDGQEVARYPASGTASFTVDDAGIILELVLVPLDDPGAGLTTTIDAATEQSWRDYIFARFPAAQVDTSVADPIDLTTTIAPAGNGWSDAMSAVQQQRNDDAVAANVFYVGLFDPGVNLAQWCASGCITALTSGNGDYEPANHLLVAVDIDDLGVAEGAWALAVTQGMKTTGCSVSGQNVEVDYPHPDGTTAGWGYDLVDELLHPPTSVDVASQCGGDIWVSDYTFAKLFSYHQQIAADL